MYKANENFRELKSENFESDELCFIFENVILN